MSDPVLVRYVKLTTNGYVHPIKENTTQTICGVNYLNSRYDYMTLNENELNPNMHVVCYKCQNKRHEFPGTIKEAFTPKKKER